MTTRADALYGYMMPVVGGALESQGVASVSSSSSTINWLTQTGTALLIPTRGIRT
jgi:hypothetical protein